MKQLTLTDDETKFLSQLISQLTLNPAAPDAARVVALVHALINKLQTGETTHA